MGTPEFARKSLHRLYNDGHNILAVFTGADKKRGRGMKLSPGPVKELALSYNTPVYTPFEMTAELIASFDCDLIAVVAYGKMLPESILNIPPLGCINIHGSLLPKYRGASPIQHAVLNGESLTGVTSQYMVKEMDAGDVIFMKEINIKPDDTSEDLFKRLGELGADLLSETVTAIGQGNAPRIAQKAEDATFAPLLKKEESLIDFSDTAYKIKCKVQAFIPWPVASMELGSKVVKVYGVEITDNNTSLSPGEVIPDSKHGIEIACKDGTIIITKLQAPGGKIMSVKDYLRGNRIL